MSDARARLALAAILLLALALRAPSLGWGFFLDDHGQQLCLEGEFVSPTMSPFNVFDFGHAPVPGEPFYDDGSFPWWTGPQWKGRLLRPLASWSMALDQALFGRWALGHHATSLALYALVLLATHRLYRAVGLGARTALVALAIVACEDGSVFVVGWIANRNTLLEALFAVLAFTAAWRAREAPPGRAPRRAALAAIGCALAATLAKESGVASLGLVALLLARRERALALVAAALASAYAAFFVAAGYGVRAALYPAPWLPGGLVPYLENLLVTLVLLPVSAVTPFTVDPIAFEPVLRRAAIAVGLVATPLAARAIWSRVKSAPGARWLALWAFAALLPQSLAPASDRLVFVPALALAALVASYLEIELGGGPMKAGGHAPAAGRRSTRPRWLAVAVALAALPLSGLMAALRSATWGPWVEALEEVTLAAELEPLGGPLEAGRRDVLVLQYPSAIAGFGSGSVWRFETGDRRTRWFPLQLGRRALEWTGVDATSFDLVSQDEPFGTVFLEAVFRDEARTPEVGERWRTAAFEVEARAVGGGGATAIRVRCDAPLDELVFLTWRGGRLARIAPPAPGQTLHLGRVEPLLRFLP